MLRNKYSIFTTLDRSTGKSDMEDIDAIFHDLLDHLRFSDGRGVREVMEERKLAEEARLAEEEELARRAALQQDDDVKSVDSFQSDSMVSKPSSREGARFGDAEEEVVEEDNLNIADPQLMDDLVKAKADMNNKRDQFIATMDSTLSEDEKADLLAKFDAQMNEMARQL
jgi:HD superfamily phosphodiesterase